MGGGGGERHGIELPLDKGSAPLVGGGGLALSVFLAVAATYRLLRFLRCYDWRWREAARYACLCICMYVCVHTRLCGDGMGWEGVGVGIHIHTHTYTHLSLTHTRYITQ